MYVVGGGFGGGDLAKFSLTLGCNVAPSTMVEVVQFLATQFRACGIKFYDLVPTV